MEINNFFSLFFNSLGTDTPASPSTELTYLLNQIITPAAVGNSSNTQDENSQVVQVSENRQEDLDSCEKIDFDINKEDLDCESVEKTGKHKKSFNIIYIK